MFSRSVVHHDWAVWLNSLSLLETARWLHNVGFNVFPLQHGTKNGFPYPWGRLSYTRLPAESLPHVFAGQSNMAVMMGTTSDNLFALDCETRTAFELCLAELEKRGIPICAVQSARGGHVYLRGEGIVQNIPSGTIPDLEVRGTNGYVLLPPSLHPSGVLYRFHQWEQAQPPLIDVRALDFLADKNGKPVELHIKTTSRSFPTSPQSKLTHKTREYLAQGGTLSEGSRNLRLFSAATDLLGCGFSTSQTESTLIPIATRSGLSLAEVQRTLHNASSKARSSHKVLRLSSPLSIEERPTSQPAHDPTIQALWAFAQRTKVTAGRLGDSERRVLLAMVALYKRGANAQGVFRGSQREWLELAHLSDYHASEKALQRLQQPTADHEPILRQAGNDKLSGARLWQIGAWVFAEGERLLRESTARAASVRQGQGMGVDTLNNADYLERGALGINGYLIYTALCEAGQPLKLKEIIERTNLTEDTVRYHLREERPLRRQGLVQIQGGKRNRTYSAIPLPHEALNEQIAVPCGTAGKSERRHAKHQQERAWFVAGLIVRRMERLWLAAAKTQVSIPDEPQAATVSLWRCPNCGQTWFGDDPPDVCDFCHDMTTWRQQ
jgi:rubrerythrin